MDAHSLLFLLPGGTVIGGSYFAYQLYKNKKFGFQNLAPRDYKNPPQEEENDQ